jgi:alpha-ketoglutarate-dependent taurine dioxygenase
MHVRRLSDFGGVSVEGVDLAAARSAEEHQALRGLLDQHGLVVFRNQNLTKQQLVAAGDSFGGTVLQRPAAAMDPDVPGLYMLSTRGPRGDVMPESPDELIGEAGWHTDDGYVTNPVRGKILYAVDVPEEGGTTGFIDGYTAYNALPERLRARIEKLHVIQNWDGSQAQMAVNRRYLEKGDEVYTLKKFPDVVYPFVYPHPVSGARVLNCPPLWATGVLEMPGAEGAELLAEVKAHLTQPQFQYWHKYAVGDAVLWDNWRYTHAASGTRGRYVRTMWVVTLRAGPRIGRELH